MLTLLWMEQMSPRAPCYIYIKGDRVAPPLFISLCLCAPLSFPFPITPLPPPPIFLYTQIPLLPVINKWGEGGGGKKGKKGCFLFYGINTPLSLLLFPSKKAPATPLYRTPFFLPPFTYHSLLPSLSLRREREG